MNGIYLYGIIWDPDKVDLGIAGLCAASPMYTIAHDGLACLVSEYDGEEFGKLTKEKLVTSLLAHQRAVEEAMRDHIVLPAKFGTILDDAHDAQELLSRGHTQFMEALASIEGKVQVEVAATWDVGQMLQKIGQEAEIVLARQAVIHTGGPTMEERVRLGQLVKVHLDQRRDRYRDFMLAALEPLALAVAPNPLISDELVMNVAFLMDRCRQGEFDGALQELDRLVGAEVNFRVLSPLPPYSFSMVEITRITPQQMEEARNTLQLTGTLSEVAVRQAYRRLAAETLGSRDLEDHLTRERFKGVRQASELLLQCCPRQGKGQQDANVSSLIGCSEEPMFVIAIKGSGGAEIEASRFGKSEEVA